MAKGPGKAVSGAIRAMASRAKAPIAKVAIADSNLHSGGDSPFFQALSGAGLVGCIETNEQLSTSYKQHIDFSAKVVMQA
jgi:hypothetical protein